MIYVVCMIYMICIICPAWGCFVRRTPITHTYHTPIQEPRVQLERRDADAEIEDAVADREKPRKSSPALRQDRRTQPSLENLRRDM